MSIEEGFDRAVDRLWSWARWQVGLTQGKSRLGAAAGFQPSIATGGLVLAALAYQLVSGGLLLLYYQPSVYPTETLCGQAAGTTSASPAAWCSTYYIAHSVPMGGVLLTSHLYGAYVVVFLVLLHLFRGYFVGAYKQPGGRLSWGLGVVLLLLTLGMGFTGYLLAYTQLSYNATQVSVTLVQALPLVGPSLANLVIGDGTPQSLLSRMFAAHVVLLPAAIALLAFLHKRSPLFPRAFASLAKWGLLYVGMLLGLATLWLWPLPTFAGNSGVSQPATVPAWFFLWLFKLVDFVGVTPEVAMLFAVVVVLFLLLVPFLDRSKSPLPRDRPVFVFLGTSLVGFFVFMTAWGDLAPGVPITPSVAALRLGPVLAANAVAAAVFHGRYQHAVRREVAEPHRVLEGRSTGIRQRSAFALSPRLFSVLGLIVAVFLLPFGLVLPFLFLIAGVLVHLAESTKPEVLGKKPTDLPSTGDTVYPFVAFSAAAFLLIVVGLSVFG